MKYDSRNDGAALADLEAVRKAYEKLGTEDGISFDMESIWNPYLDSRFIVEPKIYEEDIKSMAVCIDGIAYVIEDVRKNCASLLVSHHPDGKAKASMHLVLKMQVDLFEKFGIDIGSVGDLGHEYSIRRIYEKAIRASREDNKGDITEMLPDYARKDPIVPWIVLHTVADNCATYYLQNLFDKEKPKTMGEILNLLMNIEEYKIGVNELIGPRIVVGSKSRDAGRIMVDMTGGEESPEEVFPALSKKVNTIVCMHASKEWYTEAEKHQVGIICAGHSPSDSLGMNLLLDEITPEEIKIYSDLGGFRRVNREKSLLSEI